MYKTFSFCSGQFLCGNNDENLVDDLLSILKNEVTTKKAKNVDILQLSSQICLRLNGKILNDFPSFPVIQYIPEICSLLTS